MIRQMELSVTATTGGGASCVVPPMPTSAGGVPTNPMQGGTGVVVTATDIPAKGKDYDRPLRSVDGLRSTRAGTMQWADSEAKFILNFAPLNMPDHHHAYQHEKGFQPDALFKIYQWYATNFAYLLAQLDAVKEGDGTTLLDNTLVFAISEVQMPNDHGQTNMPFTWRQGAGQGQDRPVDQDQAPAAQQLARLASNIFGGTETVR